MNIFEYRQVKDSLWIIGERYSGEHFSDDYALTIGLIIGKDRAAVVDTGMGVTEDLRKVCEEITDKPLVCLLTHGHPDHAGAAVLFNKIYMSELDNDELKWALPVEKRLSDLKVFSGGNEKLIDYCSEHVIPDETFEYKNIKDGDIFDLGGGIKLQAIAVPGHSLGSMCFHNRDENYILTGDSMNPLEILNLSYVTIDDYKKNLKRFLSIVPDDVEMYFGHSQKPITTQMTKDLIAACDEIMRGQTADDKEMPPMFEDMKDDFKHLYIHNHGIANLVYNASLI